MKQIWDNYLPYVLSLNEKSAPLSGPLRRERVQLARAAHSNPKIKKIPAGAVIIPLPNVPQPDGISCGDATLLAILMYYGVGVKTIRAVKEEVHTDRDDGTYYKYIKRYVDELGLRATVVKGMTLGRLQTNLKRGRPVICSIQAYGKPQDYNRDDVDNGHFVVAIGFDDHNLYFMDPSIPAWDRRRGWLSKEEFVYRWHDDEGSRGRPEIIRRLGIVIYPKPGHTAFLRRAHKIV